MKKILTSLLIIIMVFIISGCGKKPEVVEKKDYTLGETIVMDGWKITFINYSIRDAIKNSKYSKLIFLEVEVENTKSKENKFPIANYDVYNTKDLKIEKVASSSDYSTSIHAGTIMPKGKTNGHIIFQFDGYGTYTLIFKDKSHNEKFKLNVYEDGE